MKTFKTWLATIAVLLCSISVSAHDFEVNGIYYKILTGAKKTVAVTCKGQTWIDFKEYSGSIVIPESVIYNENTYSVTSIGWSAFRDCMDLISVVIPNSVTTIEEYAFFDCGLTSVTFGNGLRSIGPGAFTSCKLSSITIPNSVVSISENAFRNCDIVELYCFAENVPSTHTDAFFKYNGNYVKDATLYVPDASLSLYKTTDPWMNFGTIKPIVHNVEIADNIEHFIQNEEEECDTITYTRTLPNLKWNALFVPFEINVTQLNESYDVAYINDIHSYDNDDNGEIDNMTMEVIKIKNGTLKANHPYLIRAKNEDAKQMSIVVTDATLYSSTNRTIITCSSAYTNFAIKGTYEQMTSEDLTGCYAINTDGAWSPVANGATLNPFRLYMTITNRDGSPVKVEQSAQSRIIIRVQGEDTETGIMETENEEVKTEIFDLSGRKVLAPQKGGIYLVNGKKLVW